LIFGYDHRFKYLKLKSINKTSDSHQPGPDPPASRVLTPHDQGLERRGERVPEGASDPGVVQRTQVPGQLLNVRLGGGHGRLRIKVYCFTLSMPGPPAGSVPGLLTKENSFSTAVILNKYGAKYMIGSPKASKFAFMLIARCIEALSTRMVMVLRQSVSRSPAPC
jgi:hypothetical protein